MSNKDWIFEEKVTEDFRQNGIFTVAKISLVSYGDSNDEYIFRNFKCNNQDLIKKIGIQRNGVNILQIEQDVQKIFMQVRQKNQIDDESVLPLEYMDVSLIENINEPLLLNIWFFDVPDDLLLEYDVYRRPLF